MHFSQYKRTQKDKFTALRNMIFAAGRHCASLAVQCVLLLGILCFAGCKTTAPEGVVENKPVNVQVIGRSLLVEIMEEMTPKATTVMIYSVKDGKLLFQATVGTGMDEIVPRSALRPFIMAAALAEAGVTLDEKFDFGDGTVKVRGRVFREKGMSGEQPFSAIIARPGFIGTMLIMKRVGREKLESYFHKAGFNLENQIKDTARFSHGSGFQVDAEALCAGWCLLAQTPEFMELTSWPCVAADMRGRYGDHIELVIGPVTRQNGEYVLLTMVEGGSKLPFIGGSPLMEIWQDFSAEFAKLDKNGK